MGGKFRKIQKNTSSEKIAIVGLNAEEYSLIKVIWTRIEFEPKIHGTGFYLRFFAKYPQYIKYFLNDPIRDDVNPDALMMVKFTVVMEILGYLILDFYDKPKEFNQMIGYIAMMHKDMNLNLDDTNKFFTALIDYLKDSMSDLMTESSEALFVIYFRKIQELMIESMKVERQRFIEENEVEVVPRSHFKAIVVVSAASFCCSKETQKSRYTHETLKIVETDFYRIIEWIESLCDVEPCAWFESSRKLIYGQPREYWKLRQQEWQSKMKSWEEQDNQMLVPGAINLQNTLESTSSEDEIPEWRKGQNSSDLEMRNSYENENENENENANENENENEDEDSFSNISSYKKYPYDRLVSVPHFDQFIPQSSNIIATNEVEKSYLINFHSDNKNQLTPRERHRAKVAAIKSLAPKPSRRLISSTDTGTPRNSDSSSARVRRRSTWN